jgi:hypothetical protein
MVSQLLFLSATVVFWSEFSSKYTHASGMDCLAYALNVMSDFAEKDLHVTQLLKLLKEFRDEIETHKLKLDTSTYRSSHRSPLRRHSQTDIVQLIRQTSPDEWDFSEVTTPQGSSRNNSTGSQAPELSDSDHSSPTTSLVNESQRRDEQQDPTLALPASFSHDGLASGSQFHNTPNMASHQFGMSSMSVDTSIYSGGLDFDFTKYDCRLQSRGCELTH